MLQPETKFYSREICETFNISLKWKLFPRIIFRVGINPINKSCASETDENSHWQGPGSRVFFTTRWRSSSKGLRGNSRLQREYRRWDLRRAMALCRVAGDWALPRVTQS